MSSKSHRNPPALLVRAVSYFVAFVLLAGPLAATRAPAEQSPATSDANQPSGEGWPTYGGDPGGLRYSTSSQITRDNVEQLHSVWTFHTHALDGGIDPTLVPSFESTPVLWGDTLYLTSPYDVVFAVDARTGAERWRYDPKLAKLVEFSIVTSRGVALWPLNSALGSNLPACSRRVFVGTLDARLLALDAASGQICTGFGDRGSVDLKVGIHFQDIGFYGVTSPPTVIGNVVVVGSTIGDNQQVDIESGAVRGYDAVSGKLLWSWEPLSWAASQTVRTGAGNTWSVISADPALGLVYLPTGSAAPDIYGGLRPGDDRDANSVVALDAATGKKVWAFQVVHHDIWDYDIPSEPVLFTWRGTTPALAVTTKMGMIFLLDRRTGQPLVPVEERPVPQSDVPGERTSATQPFQNIPTLAPLEMGKVDSIAYQRPAADAEICREELAGLRYEGIYTPASLKGTLNFPGPTGGVTWGGAAIDPNTGILYANTNRQASILRLVPRYGAEHIGDVIGIYLFNKMLWFLFFLLVLRRACVQRHSLNPGWKPLVVLLVCACVFGGRQIYRTWFSHGRPVLRSDPFVYELSPQRKSPYLVERHGPVDSRGLNCAPAPWGAITAVNLNTLTKMWERPLGTTGSGQETGIRSFGGPIVTGAGLVITAAAEDSWLRVFDAASGAELKQLRLPVPATATPMTYTLDGRQYIVVAAGGHGDRTVPLGDSLMAFSVN